MRKVLKIKDWLTKKNTCYRVEFPDELLKQIQDNFRRMYEHINNSFANTKTLMEEFEEIQKGEKIKDFWTPDLAIQLDKLKQKDERD